MRSICVTSPSPRRAYDPEAPVKARSVSGFFDQDMRKILMEQLNLVEIQLAEDSRREKNWKTLGAISRASANGAPCAKTIAGRDGVGLLPPRPRPLPRLSLGRGRPARHHRSRMRASASPWRSGTAATPSSRSASSASPARRATMAKT